MELLRTSSRLPSRSATRSLATAALVLASCTGTITGGPGATGRSYSSFDTIISSIKAKLLTLPGDTEVRTGHGDSTRIGAESPHLEQWIARGH